MGAQALINELNNIFWNRELNDDEIANEFLDLMDVNREIVELDAALNDAYRTLNIWSRTENETGIYLDQIKDVLHLEEDK